MGGCISLLLTAPESLKEEEGTAKNRKVKQQSHDSLGRNGRRFDCLGAI